MTVVDGATLRQLRQQAGVGLRRIASGAKVPVSDGHLSRVERGHRPVTPAIVAAYERVLGVRVADVLACRRRSGGWDEQERRAFLTRVATVAVGGPPGEPVERLLAAGGAVTAPADVGMVDVAHVEQVVALVRDLDLRFGGGLTWQLGRDLLRWAVGLRSGWMDDRVRSRLDAAVAALATRVAWAAFDAGRFDAARATAMVALEAAVRSEEVDLRAHVLAEIAAQYNDRGHPDESLTVARLADGDERVGEATRCLLHAVKAWAYAAKGDRHGCLRHLDLAEAAAGAVRPDAVPAWWGDFAPAHVEAMAGHAVAVLAGRSADDGDLTDAEKRLTRAVEGLDLAGRTRAAVLCRARLATLFAQAGEREQAAAWARQAVQTATGLRSERVRRALATVQETTPVDGGPSTDAGPSDGASSLPTSVE